MDVWCWLGSYFGIVSIDCRTGSGVQRYVTPIKRSPRIFRASLWSNSRLRFRSRLNHDLSPCRDYNIYFEHLRFSCLYAIVSDATL